MNLSSDIHLMFSLAYGLRLFHRKSTGFKMKRHAGTEAPDVARRIVLCLHAYLRLPNLELGKARLTLLMLNDWCNRGTGMSEACCEQPHWLPGSGTRCWTRQGDASGQGCLCPALHSLRATALATAVSTARSHAEDPSFL